MGLGTQPPSMWPTRPLSYEPAGFASLVLLWEWEAMHAGRPAARGVPGSAWAAWPACAPEAVTGRRGPVSASVPFIMLVCNRWQV